MPVHLELHGCRHDILGHYLKAIGLLRVLAKCAAPEHRDPDAEGWWDKDKACFCLRSPKYLIREKLVEFFAQHYQPTPIFAAWKSVPGSDASGSKKLGVLKDWEIANELSSQVVSAIDRKKPVNKDKLIAIEVLVRYRESAASEAIEALDAITSPFLRSNSDNPLFLSKASAGQANILRTHWGYLDEFAQMRAKREQAAQRVAEHLNGDEKLAKLLEKADAVERQVAAHRGTEKQLDKLRTKLDAARLNVASHRARKAEELTELTKTWETAQKAFADLVPTEAGCVSAKQGLGTPFFPDAIKGYNIGSGWVTQDFPFNALDYILAVEGAFAMRGSVGRKLAANSRRFAGFPFVFDAAEEMVNKDGNTESTASALWFPLWERPVTFSELSSFIADAQARLPGKEVRFSAEFMRALHCQGVDAGFMGWQEFRFRQRITDVPWVTTGGYIHSEGFSRENATRLNRALHPLDEAQFLSQFEIVWAKGGKRRADSKSPHPVRAAINAAMENAARETTPHHCIELLGTVFRACRQMAISESFRDTLPGRRARFFRPLPMDDWNELLRDMKEPEFRIARAVASVVGKMKQPNRDDSEVLPMLGSLLPLKLGPSGWFLPTKGDLSKQAVWTGTDVCLDLAAVLARRYLDSLRDERPALVSSFGAPLEDVLAFLRGELDDHLIARWIEALSLIGWRLMKVEDKPNDDWQPAAIPPEYAALRTLLEVECEPRKEGDTRKRRSQQPIGLLCPRSSSTLPLAVTEALRWIAIWGVPNPDCEAAQEGKERLTGRDIIKPATFAPSTDATRLAAAVCIPLHWRDRNSIYRAVSLPQGD